MIARDQERRPPAVLVPGLWLPGWAMWPMARRLERCGVRCARFDYPWISATLDENARRLAAHIAALGCARVDLVGYSLGGVLALYATASLGLAPVRRIVLVGSPYADSHAARKLAQWRIGRRLLGRTVPDWLARTKPPAPQGVEVGVIAGTVGFGLGILLAPDLPRPHDGVISLRETPVPGMADSVQLRMHHSRMLVSAQVAALACRFLRHGRFTADAGARGHAAREAAAPGELRS